MVAVIIFARNSGGINMEEYMKKTVSFVAIVLALVCVFAFAACTPNGGKEFDANKNITVITREDGSGTKSAFMEILGLKGKKDVSGVIQVNSTDAVLAGVKTNPYAIAFDSLGFVTGRDGVKILTVDGVAPTSATIKNGTYAISRPLSIVYKEATLENKLYKAYFDFLKSSQAQEIVANGYKQLTQGGYIVNVDNPTEYVADTTITEGTIAISGSTSLKPLMEGLAAKFEELQPGVTVEVGGGGSGQGYKDAEQGVSVFGMISEPFTQSKAESCTSTVVALDGIAVIVNASNPLNNISKADLATIYNVDAGDAAIKTWAGLNK